MYNSEDEIKKLEWRFGYAGIYKASISVPKGGHALLMPYDFNDGKNRVKQDSQPDVWRNAKVAKEHQMVCIDGSIYPQQDKQDDGTLTRHPKAGKQNKEIYNSNKKIKGDFIHEYGRAEQVIKKYNPYIMDYDGMSNVNVETPRVVEIIKYVNTLDHDCALLINCNKKLKGQQGPNIKGTTLSEFKKRAEFKRAIRNTEFYQWEVISKPKNATTRYLPMETFVLYKHENPKANQKLKKAEMKRLFEEKAVEEKAKKTVSKGNAYYDSLTFAEKVAYTCKKKRLAKKRGLNK